jgi:hypothetical protein
MAGGDGLERGLEIGEGLDAVDLCGLCRTPNYAERAGFPQLSF